MVVLQYSQVMKISILKEHDDLTDDELKKKGTRGGIETAALMRGSDI